LIFEGESRPGKMLCLPWQSEQLAAVSLPFATARPCTLCRYNSMGCANGILWRERNPGLLWQTAHVSGKFFLATGEAASFAGWIWCTGPWQETQFGASGSPLVAAVPWMLSRNSFTSGAWHCPHFAGAI
jgi:hypothetical protein